MKIFFQMLCLYDDFINKTVLCYVSGPVIGLELCGDNVIKYCQDQIVNIMKGTTGLVFVSQNKTLAKKQIENFFNYADMQMKI